MRRPRPTSGGFGESPFAFIPPERSAGAGPPRIAADVKQKLFYYLYRSLLSRRTKKSFKLSVVLEKKNKHLTLEIPSGLLVALVARAIKRCVYTPRDYLIDRWFSLPLVVVLPPLKTRT